MEFALADQIKGFLDFEEGLRLYDLALEAGVLGPCLEIGSYCGRSALFLGAACREKGTVLFSIDHHRGSEEQQPGEQYFDSALFDPKAFTVDTFGCFRRTLKAAYLEEHVVPLVCTSATAARVWTMPLGLVFIDGGHSFETVSRDYDIWGGHVVPGGYLLIHDIFEKPSEGGQGPYRVYQKAQSCGLFSALPMTGSLGVLQRRLT